MSSKKKLTTGPPDDPAAILTDLGTLPFDLPDGNTEALRLMRQALDSEEGQELARKRRTEDLDKDGFRREFTKLMKSLASNK